MSASASISEGDELDLAMRRSVVFDEGNVVRFRGIVERVFQESCVDRSSDEVSVDTGGAPKPSGGSSCRTQTMLWRGSSGPRSPTNQSHPKPFGGLSSCTVVHEKH